MDLVARTNILLWTWIQSLRSAKKLSLFIPFLLFALLQTVILVLFLFFYSLPLAGIFIPLVRRLSGESALHYPQLYMHLPRLFSIANVWLLNPLMGWLFIGAATFLFAAWYRGQFVDAGRGLSMALGRTVPLLAVGLVEWGAVKLVVWLFGLSSTAVMRWGSQSPRLLMLVSFFVHVAVLTPFAYTSAEVVLRGRGIGGALRGSFTLAGKNFGLTYLLFAVPSLLTLMMSMAFQYAPRIVAKFSPDVMVLLMAISIVMTLVVNFLIVGALTALYLRSTEQIT